MRTRVLGSLVILGLAWAAFHLIACSRYPRSANITVTGPQVQAVVTTGDRTKLLQAETPLSFATGGNSSSVTISVDESTRFQIIDGFGGSLTDSSAWLIAKKLDAAQQQTLMQQFFDPKAGIGLSFLRHPMAASDFTVSGNYSYDDVPSGSTDPNLSAFSIARDAEYTIPLLKRALALNPAIKIVALPWSPPAWMKTNGSMNAGEMNPTYFPALAQYFVKFLQAYQQQGIPIYAVTVQNEPLNSNNLYPTEYLPADAEANFIAHHLGPAFSAAGLSSVKIFGYEHNWDDTSYPETLLQGPASNYVAGTAFHCYAGDVNAQSTVHAAFPNKDLWFTECSGTVGSSFAGDLVWNSQHLLIGATRNWARAVSLWNLALDQNSGPKNGGCERCRGVVTIDSSKSPAAITYNVEYYVLAHLSKYVVPGAHRITSNTFASDHLEDVAFQNPDGSIVLFVLNSGSASNSFSVSWHGKAFAYSLPPQSVATFTWK